MANRIIRTCFLFGMAAGLGLATVAWKPLFNGQNMTGWHIAGDKTFWSVDPVDSAMVGFTNTVVTPYSMVFSDSSFDQFTVKYSYRLKAGCSGFFFRTLETASSPYVAGVQVEVKWQAGVAASSYVGSLYNSGGNQDPNNSNVPQGWIATTSNAFGAKAIPTDAVYQNVVLTVKKPYIYVNVNGNQAVGETDAALITAGAARALNYVTTGVLFNPGKFGLQIHDGQKPMDVRFKNIALLTGCGDSSKAAFDGKFVEGMPKQPAVYRDNGTCISAAVTGQPSGEPYLDGRKFIDAVETIGNHLVVRISYPQPHSLQLRSLAGRIAYSSASPEAKEYRIPLPSQRGIYFVEVRSQKNTFVRKVIVE